MIDTSNSSTENNNNTTTSNNNTNTTSISSQSQSQSIPSSLHTSWYHPDIEPFVALVTGSNRGIGLEIIKQLAIKYSALPHTYIYATVRNKETDVTELQQLNKEYHGCIHIVYCDISDFQSIKEAGESIGREVNHMNLLINNAAVSGIHHYDDNFLTCDLRDFSNVLRINTVSQVAMIQSFHSLMQQSKSQPSLCINMSSRNASHVHAKEYGFCASYRASKSALNMVTACLSHDDPSTIYLSISPGHVQTTMGQLGRMKPPLTAEQSVTGILSIAYRVTPKDSGSYYSYDGTIMPW